MSETIPVSEEATFSTLREANQARQIEWDVGNQISLAYRGNEFAGEAGEVCNVIKKIERERMGIAGSRDTVEHLAEELADAVICADLIAMTAGIDLEAAVEAKFNATSEKVGLSTRYRRTHPVANAAPADREVRNAALKEAERAVKGWLAGWSHDLFDTWESYVEAKTTGKFGGRRISNEDADHYAKRFRERAEAVDGCIAGVTDAILALKDKSPPAPQPEAVPERREIVERLQHVHELAAAARDRRANGKQVPADLQEIVEASRPTPIAALQQESPRAEADDLATVEALISLVEADVESNATAEDPDDDSVGWNGDGSDLPMTFGHVRRARAAIDRLIGSALAHPLHQPAPDAGKVREEAEEHFKKHIGHYETPEELARGMRMSADYFRDQQPMGYVPQPRLMADFHDRVAVALERFIAAAPAPEPQALVPDGVITEAMVKHMVDRFLTWKLPEDFGPDAGISFTREYGQNTQFPGRHEPVGTNLFSAVQATAMVRHMVAGMATHAPVPDGVTVKLPSWWRPSGKLADAIEAYRSVKADFDAFDGDRRGIAAALSECEFDIVAAIAADHAGDDDDNYFAVKIMADALRAALTASAKQGSGE